MIYKIETLDGEIYTTCNKLLAISQLGNSNYQVIENEVFKIDSFHSKYLSGQIIIIGIEIEFTFTMEVSGEDECNYYATLIDCDNLSPELRNDIVELIENRLFEAQEFHVDFGMKSWSIEDDLDIYENRY